MSGTKGKNRAFPRERRSRILTGMGLTHRRFFTVTGTAQPDWVYTTRQSVSINHKQSRGIMLKRKFGFPLVLLALSCGATMGVAGEGDITIPDLTMVKFDGLGGMSGAALMYLGLVICGIGAVFGLVQYKQTNALPVHDSMRNVSNIIWETCKTYLWTQGKFLMILWLLIAACMIYYFKVLQDNTPGHVIII